MNVHTFTGQGDPQQWVNNMLIGMADGMKAQHVRLVHDALPSFVVMAQLQPRESVGR